MGKQPYQIKRERREANERAVKGAGYRDDARAESVAAFKEARSKRAHKSGSSGGFIPSAKHVEGGMERYATNAVGHRNNRPSLCIEGTERYDALGPAANRPLDRYRAPSLRTRVDPVRPEITPDYGRVGRGAPAVRAPEVQVYNDVKRANEYARRGDYTGAAPTLLPLPPVARPAVPHPIEYSTEVGILYYGRIISLRGEPLTFS